MTQKKNQYFRISITLSIISILITILINFQIAKAYLSSDGKTKAFFGLSELLRFGYQYYVGIIGIVSLTFAIISLEKGKNLIGIFLSLLAILFVFFRIWRLFI
jgi:hypothetical protein